MLLRNAPAARVTLDLFLQWGNQIACLPKTSNVLNRFIGLSSNRVLHYGRVYTRLIVVKSCRARRSTHTGTIRISLVDSVIRQLYIMQIRARFGQIPLILSFFQIIRFIFGPCMSTKFTPNAGDIWFGILGFQQCWLADLKCFLSGFCTEKYLSLIIRYDSNIIKSKQRKEPSANRASLVHQTWVSSSCMFFCWYFCLLSCKTSFSRYRSEFALYKRKVSSCKYFRVPLSEP